METLTRTFSNISDGMPVSVITDVSSWPMLTALLTVVATLAFYQLVLAPPSSLRPKGSRIKPIFSSFPFLGSVGFYSDRVGFLRKHFGDPESSSFHGDARRITVRDATVVLLAGNKDDAKMFYYSRALKFTQAYMKLLSGIPSEITTAAIMNQDKADQMFNENLKQAIRGERLAKLAPLLCEDTVRALDAVPDWKKGKGSMDPKAFTFPLLFCMSMRTVGFSDLSDDPKIVEELAGYYWAMKDAASFWSTFFTKYPFRTSSLKEESGKKLFAALGKAAYSRFVKDLVEDVTVGMLLDNGMDADYVVRKSRVEQLQALSLAEWENGFPTIEAALKETIRLNADGTQFRLNAGDATAGTSAPKVQGEEVHKGEFLGYCDPDRWARGEGSGDMEYLGWGTGMHPCTGMRFAKLEIKNFATTILALMDWESYNPRSGEVYTIGTLPAPQLNYGHRLPLGPVSLRFTRR
ncbi:unnamed protein product [Tilletia laevis]|uniref:Cytochrome P450 n=2 Tax=Tilletia TaxID=13289 RepID=A0A9N8L814_9BASI|nr:unnamed protein product [Tilletia caries]CAD6899094.1 unnamed protein product [Tilletia laevis]CAD6941355.1 unnamed protein product [Tilletia laevis]